MAQHIHVCSSCKRYTLEETCPLCSKPTALARPPKYSPDDKYAEYRRKIKKEELEQKNLI